MDTLRKNNISVPIRLRGRCTLFALAILCLLPCGCATLELRNAIALETPYTREKHPRYSDGGYSDQYKGKIRWGNSDYFVFTFRNPFLTGDRPGHSGRSVGVLVPVDSPAEKRAVLFEHNVGGQHTILIEEISACLRKNRVPDNVIAAYRAVLWHTYTQRGAHHAAAYTAFSEKELFALQGYADLTFNPPLRQEISSRHGEPEIAGFLLDEKERPVRFFLGRWAVTENDEPGWKWSDAYEVSACLTPPTLKRKIMPLGYVFTVAIDLATSPVQLPLLVALWIHGAP